MTDLTCPTCGIALEYHQAHRHLDEWIQQLFYPETEEYAALPYSSGLVLAWDLMQKVWELDPYATIHKDKIEVEGEHKDKDNLDCVECITGPTFPLRVCRAAIYLAVRGKE